MMAQRKTSSKRNGRAPVPRPRVAHEAAPSNGNGALDAPAPEQRLPVLKTYKIFISGQFPRTESGRYYVAKSPTGELLGNICRSSRKDFRDAVVAARNAQGSWASKTAYNRAQILYRVAEMLEGRAAQFRDELARAGVPASARASEVEKTIDRVLYYAGWCDKYQQVFSSVNPVATSHFNFSVLEPTGVVSVLAPEESPLLGLVSTVIPVIAGGNTCVALASTSNPLPAVTFAEVLETGDLPAGVVNLLTGYRAELTEHFANHMDVNACLYCGRDEKELAIVRTSASLNVKRVVTYDRDDWTSDDAQSPYFILDAQEVKTTWHPVGT
jgi:acyl-CoA reductase-like NAD-dependent aldehyde dehydrogenase